MKVAVPRETRPGERRVGLVPKDAAILRRRGADVAIEAGAGERAYFANRQYESAGTAVASREEVLTMRGSSAHLRRWWAFWSPWTILPR